MKNPLKIILIILLALALILIAIRIFSNEDTWLCVNGQWIPHGNPSSPMPLELCEQTACQVDTDCETPTQFLVQSNCPFGSICQDNQCRVVCPLFEATCSSDEDCDCSQRGEKTKDCICRDGVCLSIEA